jgi:(1->4)-alpha-D-glucan 1-alpha-D-glucosylmutase
MKESEYDAFKKRIKEYMLKAAREAKVHTSWISPNLIHEEALLKFIETVLTNSNDNLFLKDFEILQKKIAYFGMFNSLSQTLLKITSPGIPDFFQGTEIWDFSLVDPDNRRPVNFSIRQNMLRQLKKKIVRFESGPWNLTRELLLNWGDGSIKLFVTCKALNYRKEHHQLFEDGLYLPLRSEGDLRENVCAFARQREDEVVIIIVPRLLTALIKDFHEFPLGKEIWGNSKIIIPEEASGNKFHNIFTGETIAETKQEGKRKLALGEIFANFPVALLEKEVE